MQKKNKSVILENKEVKFQLRLSRRARRARLTAYQDGNLVVTIPQGCSENSAEKFMKAKARWILAKLKYFARFKARPYLWRGRRPEYLKLKEKALSLAQEKVYSFNQFYNFKIGRVSVKNQKTRWGSCSKKGNLNFNYKILFLPERLCDYIIVHELCHLAEFNHSKRFWGLVTKMVPDCRDVRREINI